MDLSYLEALMGEAIEESPYQGILVVAGVKDGEPTAHSLEVLGKARELADALGAYVSAVLFAAGEEPARKLIGYGADCVYILDNPVLVEYALETYAKALGDFIQDRKPEIVLFPADAVGRELAPYLAQKLEASLVTNCTELGLDESARLLLATHPMYGGEYFRLLAAPEAKPQMATLLPGYFRPSFYDESRAGEVERVKADLNGVEPGVTVKGPADYEEHRCLECASIVISVGRGAGGEEELRLVKELAAALDAELAGSRGAVDDNLIESDRQVGMSGKQIAPRLYIACGISGAIHHYYGIRKAKCIVAINSDPTAPIFKVADLGIIGDVKEIIPAVLKELG